jgi:hypothetical protein
MHNRNRHKLDKTGVQALAQGGVTVVGILSDDDKVIIWGAIKCYGVNYDKALGREGARNIAADTGVVSVNLDYEQAKDYAVALGHLVYENGVTVGLEKFQKIVIEDGNSL